MKFKVTRKEIKENYRAVSVPYCELQHLLRYRNPIAYNSGIYGWNYNMYDFSCDFSTNICICTGYRGCPGIRVERDLYVKYEEAAKEIVYGNPYQEVKSKLDDLIREFLDEIERTYFN